MSSTVSANEKFTRKWAWLGSINQFWNFGTLYIFGMVINRNFVFGAQTEHNYYYPLDGKLTPKVGGSQGHVT